MESRIHALEIKIMELEISVEDLNDVIVRQYMIIEQLQSVQKQLTYRLNSLASTAAEDNINEPPPPHY